MFSISLKTGRLYHYHIPLYLHSLTVSYLLLRLLLTLSMSCPNKLLINEFLWGTFTACTYVLFCTFSNYVHYNNLISLICLMHFSNHFSSPLTIWEDKHWKVWFLAIDLLIPPIIFFFFLIFSSSSLMISS